jgi:cysteine desulfurase
VGKRGKRGQRRKIWPVGSLLKEDIFVRQIYLDYNATTPVSPAVVEAMLPFLRGHYGNPSSYHAMGRAAKEGMEDARLKLARLLGCSSDELIFTSGGTESNNLAIKGVLLSGEEGAGGHLVISAIEHAAVAEPAAFLQRLGLEVTTVGCDPQGVVSLDQIERALRPNTRLVSIMHSNNEVGTLQPIREIAALCHSRQILVHTDAVQSIGKVPITVDELDVDLLSLSAHKFFGPKGIGALFVRNGLLLEPLLHGTSQEQGRRAGTPNTPHIVGMGKAAELAWEHLDQYGSQVQGLRNRLQELLTDGIPGLQVNGHPVQRLPNTLSLSFPKLTAENLLRELPELFASLGTACHHGGLAGSSTLRAMGCDISRMAGTVRLSLSWQTEEDEIELAANWIIETWERLVGE